MPKKFDSPQEHLKELYAFRQKLKEHLLGQENKDYRDELEFVISRTNRKIKEVEAEKRKLERQ